MSRQTARLRDLDVDQVIADYQAGATIDAITSGHNIAITRLYAILDDHGVPRRRSTTRTTSLAVQRRVVADYLAGVGVEDIAYRHRVSSSTVSNIVRRAKVEMRAPDIPRDGLIDLAVRRLLGEPISNDHNAYDTLRRIGLHALRPGLASLDDIAPELRGDVAREIARRLLDRYPR